MGVLLNYPLFHADDDDGAPLTGGLLYTYIAGTTTEKATYTTRALATANANPVVLDSRGEAVVYGDGLYKLILKTSAGTTVWTQDNVQLDTGAGSYVFYVDPSETDQGTAGNGSSLYDILLAYGASASYTVVFGHNGVSNTTTYTVSTTFDASGYSNVSFVIENGARITVGAGVTLTLYSPGIIHAGNYQIFAGTGTVSYSYDYGIRYLLWGGTGTNEIGINVAPESGVELKSASLKLASGGEITELSTDTTLSGDSDLAVPTEKAVKTYVDALSYSGTSLNRAVFTYNGGSSAYTVKIGAARYLCKDKDASWTSELTSRALTADVASPVASTWYYLYLDYSAITSGTAVTNAELIWSATSPSYSHTYRGWYNSDDRCIFAMLTNTTPDNLLEFYHDGGAFIMYSNARSEAAAVAPSTTWTNVDMATSIPPFSTQALVTVRTTYVNVNSYLYWRTDDQSGTSGHNINYVAASIVYASNQVAVATDSTQVIEVKFGTAGTNTFSLEVDGWYFPGGM